MKTLLSCIIFLLAVSPLSAAYLFQKGKLVKADQAASMTVQEHFSLALAAKEQEDWQELIRQALILKKNFPENLFAEEANFLLGVGYFHLEDCEQSDKYISRYLERQVAPKHFEEAIHYKFQLAKRFHLGAKKHILGWKEMPQWAPAREDALAIYDEVISALPNQDLAAEALFGKAELLFDLDQFTESIEAYQTLIRRFPKHTLSPESYLKICDVYLVQSQKEYPDPDLLDLASINLRKFRGDFPGEDRLQNAEQKLRKMEEIYADHLYQIGKFYERTNKSNAASLYYNKVMQQYPRSQVAALSHKRLLALTPLDKKETKIEEEGQSAEANLTQ